MGVRQRAAVVVALMTMVLAGMALAPAGAQLVVLDPTTTTSRPVPTTTAEPEPTTTSRPLLTTTSVAPTTPTTSGRDRTPTARQVTTTTRRPASTTTTSVETTTTSRRPPTTGAGGFPGETSTTTGDLSVERATNVSGLSAGNVVAFIIAGLLAVALGLSALTVRYVRSTQPRDRFVA